MRSELSRDPWLADRYRRQKKRADRSLAEPVSELATQLRELNATVIPLESDQGKQLPRLLSEAARGQIRAANARETKLPHTREICLGEGLSESFRKALAFLPDRGTKVDQLIGDLNEAIGLAEDSKVLKDSLGEHVHEFLIANKRAEWDAFKSYVSPFELERYLPVL